MAAQAGHDDDKREGEAADDGEHVAQRRAPAAKQRLKYARHDHRGHHERNGPHELHHEGAPPRGDALAHAHAALLGRRVDAPCAESRPLEGVAREGQRASNGHQKGDGQDEDGLYPALLPREQAPRTREVASIFHMVCPQHVRAGWARGQAARRAIDTGSYPVVSVPEPAWEGSRGRNPCGNRCRTRTKAQSSIGFPVAGHEERFTVPFGDGPWAVSALAGVKGAPKELTELSLGAKEAHPNPGKAWFGRRKQGKSPFVTTKSKIDRSTAAGVCSFSHMHPALEHSVLARARSRVHPVLACGL